MRRPVLAIAFGATLIAAYFAPNESDSGVIAPARQAAAIPAPVALDGFSRRNAAATPHLRIRSRTSEEDFPNVFESQTWTPPPPPPKPAVTVAEPPPPPQAPPLPFRFLGRLVDQGKTAYFLQFNDRNLVMRPGDSVDNTYLLKEVSGGTLVFTYLPLQQEQILVVGEVN